MPTDLAGIGLLLLHGAIVTVKVSVGALLIALGGGLGLAVLRFLFSSRLLHWAVGVYVEVFRNIPSLTHLFIIYFGLPYFGIRMSSMTAAILGLGLIGAAVLTDVFRAGLEAPSRGQSEAALAAGMTPFMVLRLIVLPQAWRVSLPPTGNYAVGLVKDTSLVSAIAAPEIMFNARQIVNETFQTTLVYGLTALIYLTITFCLSRSIRSIERRSEHP
jgi:His/Glu/Gln/Arg/opine family amino acid ABC transporter permease subunit